MDLKIENLLRTAGIVVIGLPISLAIASSVSVSTSITKAAADKAAKETPKTEAQELKESLVRPCLDYVFSDIDSKLERTAKNDLDEAFGGGVNYKEVCKWALG